MPDAPDTSARLVAYDAAAYRALTRATEVDVEGAREAGEEAAARDRREGLTPAASVATLWALLATAAPDPAPEGAKRRTAAPDGGPTKSARRMARARAALAACLAHTAAPGATPAGAPTLPLLAPDPDLTLVHAVAGRLTAGADAWGAYLASLAAEVVAEGSIARLAGPLGHVLERARGLESEIADEIQDAVLAGYDAAGGSEGEAWGTVDDPAERQRIVAARTAVLEDALAEGRAERVWHLLGGAGASDDTAAGPDAVRAAFAPGVALWREIVRLVIGGEVELTGRRWRETLWGLQLAFPLDAPAPLPKGPPVAGAAPVAAGPLVRVVSGDRLLVEAAQTAGVDVVEL